MSANSLHNGGVDYWQGWECSSGLNRLSIVANFDVFGSLCKNDYLGNIFTEWDIYDAPTICKQPRCIGCADDLSQHKREIK